VKRLLTVAGSDSGGGAGIQADLRTFAALGCHGMSAVTAVTAQDSTGVHGWWPVPVDAVRAQIRAVVDDIGVDAVKVGMLGAADVANAVADELSGVGVPVVVDPVCVSSSGQSLLTDDALVVLRERIVPLATVVTPNREEYALLGTIDAPYVVVTGSETATDVLWHGGSSETFSGEPLGNVNTHGTGCTFAAALAARLAYGDSMSAAVRAAKEFVAAAISRGYPLGSGVGPVRQV
jgi:hydroxymethylpyrimidine/phosphomethylpyrimidine kinase